MNEVASVDFQKGDGLVPCVVQDSCTYQTLMVGFMDEEAYLKTCREGVVTFYSRTKKRLWTKGETSGNSLRVDSIHTDCDRDTVLVLATPTGPTCHTGDVSCFHEDVPRDVRFLGRLQRIIEQRIAEADVEKSYTAKLVASGEKRIAQKVAEEGVEVSLAAVAGDKEELLNESADLLYHLEVLLKAKGLSLQDVGAVLYDRCKP